MEEKVDNVKGGYPISDEVRLLALPSLIERVLVERGTAVKMDELKCPNPT